MDELAEYLSDYSDGDVFSLAASHMSVALTETAFLWWLSCAESPSTTRIDAIEWLDTFPDLPLMVSEQRCSFCGKTPNEVAMMFNELDTRICSECVAICVEAGFHEYARLRELATKKLDQMARDG